MVYAASTADVTAYDLLGRISSKTDQAGKVSQYGYDALGRLTRVTDAVNQITRYGYDEMGNQTSQTDALGRVTRFEYDKLGRRTKRTLPLGQAETYTYNVTGSMSTRRDFNGKTTTYSYDAMNRLLSKTPDASFASLGTNSANNPKAEALSRAIDWMTGLSFNANIPTARPFVRYKPTTLLAAGYVVRPDAGMPITDVHTGRPVPGFEGRTFGGGHVSVYLPRMTSSTLAPVLLCFP